MRADLRPLPYHQNRAHRRRRLRSPGIVPPALSLPAAPSPALPPLEGLPGIPAPWLPDAPALGLPARGADRWLPRAPLLELEPERCWNLTSCWSSVSWIHSTRVRGAELEGDEGDAQRASLACWRRDNHQRQHHANQCACREPAHELELMRLHEKSGVHGVYTTIAYEPVGFRSKDHTIISVATNLPPSNRGRKRVLRIF